MTKNAQGECKSKDCSNNTVFGNKYCNNCMQKRKERNKKLLGGASTVVVAGVMRYRDPMLKVAKAVISRLV